MFYPETHYRRKKPQKLDTVADNSIQARKEAKLSHKHTD